MSLKQGDQWIEKGRKYNPIRIGKVDPENGILYMIVKNDDPMNPPHEIPISFEKFYKRYVPYKNTQICYVCGERDYTNGPNKIKTTSSFVSLRIDSHVCDKCRETLSKMLDITLD